MGKASSDLDGLCKAEFGLYLDQKFSWIGSCNPAIDATTNLTDLCFYSDHFAKIKNLFNQFLSKHSQFTCFLSGSSG